MLAFYIKYYIFIAIQWLLKPKRREYLLFILGRYPSNFKSSMLSVVDSNSLVRFTMGNSILVLRFNTVKKRKDILYSLSFMDLDSFFLIGSQAKVVRNLNPIHYKHLYQAPLEKISVMETLDKIQELIFIIGKMKRDTQQFMQEQIKLIEYNDMETITDSHDHTTTTNHEEITLEEHIDPILDKIKEFGINSLTQHEVRILHLYHRRNNL